MPPTPDDPGLLHHEHPVPASPEAEYHPDTPAPPPPTDAAVREAASGAHHGLVRDHAAPVSREEEAKLALEHTRISVPLAWTLSLIFLLTIFSVPLIQITLDYRQAQAQRKQELASGGPMATSLMPHPLDVVAVLPSKDEVRAVRSPRDAWELLPTAGEIKPYEDSLQDNSFAVQWTLPKTQNLLLRVGVGNEQAYKGREEPAGRMWLHYRPDVDYVTSRGFLEPDMLLVRKRGGDQDAPEVQPDPVRAIVHFNKQLAERGITLILMPTPVKAMMQPETLSSRYRFGQGVLQNPSYTQFIQRLGKENVLFFDATQPLLEQMRRTKRAQYLETDTHWTPEGMELAAAKLAEFIKYNVGLRSKEPVGYTRETKSESNLGDISEMLKLPSDQTLIQRQTVVIHPIRRPDGDLWYPEHRADILLLGDSFSNVYSLDGMNWGASAGLAEQLSYDLQRPVDSIINNAGGSYVTRERLVREAGKRHRLRGKKVVIWQFAMRDLLIGDWKLLDLPPQS